MHTTLRVAKAREEASANCRKEDLRRFTTIEGDSRVSVSQDKTWRAKFWKTLCQIFVGPSFFSTFQDQCVGMSHISENGLCEK